MKLKSILAFLPLFLLSFLPNLLASEPYYVFDARPLNKCDYANPAEVRKVWDETLLLATLQGLANRDSARLYLVYVQAYGRNTDEFWLDVFNKEIPGSDASAPQRKGWLQDRERRDAASLDELLTVFADAYSGAVVYDEKTPSTVNVALTVAGAEKLLPVRYDAAEDSLYSKIVLNGPKLPVKARLINEDGSPMFNGKGKIPGTDLDSTGSIKTDPYYWMIENYIKTGKVDPTEGAYYIDAYWVGRPIGAVQNHCLTNRDFTVSRKGFFFDLSPWEDETPNDDREQPLGSDFNAFNAIMRAAYDAANGQKAIRVCGFTPWDTKYTDYGGVGCKHPGVPTEWRHAELLSNYNGYLDADALGLCAMANASFFQHFPLDEFYPQQKPTLDDLKAKGYVDENGKIADKTFVAIYAGDYDSAAWVYQSMPAFWFDQTRGEIPISWAFNPNLSDRFAPGFDYIRRTQTPNDFFTSGDTGAGYVNPTAFAEPRRFSNLPDGLDVWIEHSKKYFKRWDISGIGFLIDGDASTSDRKTLERLSEFSPAGITTHRGGTMGVVDNPLGGKTPFRPMNWDLDNPKHASEIVLGDVRTNMGPQFNVYRTILWTPEKLKQLQDLVKNNPDRGKRVEFVDAYSFWTLLRLEMERIDENETKIRL